MPLNLREEPLRPFNVLAFDPGGTTGWAWGQLLDPIPEKIKLEDIYLRTGEFGPKEHHQELYEMLWQIGTIHPNLKIVFEPFHFRQHMDNPRRGLELVSVEYIGVIKLACVQLGLSYYDRFTPGEAKAWCTDDKLEAIGWMQTPKHPMRHRNDALRQLVKYLIVKKGVRHPLTTMWRTSATDRH